MSPSASQRDGEMRARIVEVCRCGLLGWVVVFFGCAAMAGCIGAVVSIAGVDSMSLSIGPVGLMSAHSGPDGYGFQTEWGVGAMSYAGGIVGILFGLRNDRRHMRATLGE